MRRRGEYLLLVNAPHLFHVPSLWKKRNTQLRKVIIPLSEGPPMGVTMTTSGGGGGG